jgi:hypothetical protein
MGIVYSIFDEHVADDWSGNCKLGGATNQRIINRIGLMYQTGKTAFNEVRLIAMTFAT